MRHRPLIDVVVPVHDASRPVARAIASIRRSAVPTRIIVVLHGISANRWDLDGDDLHVEHLEDGIPSPSGPRNLGLDAALAPWVAFVDSDDELDDGVLGTLVAAAEELRVDVCIPRIDVEGTTIRTPLRTGHRAQHLDVVANDLYRRSHAFGLFRRGALADIGARFPSGIRRGEDLVFTAQVWGSLPVGIAPRAVYHLRDGAVERATTASLTPREEVAFINPILNSEWFVDLMPAHRRLLVRRCLESNLVDAIGRAGGLDAAGIFEAARDRLLSAAPDAESLLSWHAAMHLGLRAAPTIPGALLRCVPAATAGFVHPSGPIRASAAKLRSAIGDRIR